MRNSKITLFGLAIALAGAAGAKDAAADVTIDTATTTPLTTSVSGNITVEDSGSIEVDANETAITVDADATVTIDRDGELTSEDVNGTRGIVIQGGTTGNVIQNGTIQLLEDHALEDTDDDGDLDGRYATGSNRVGILLESGTFTGDITTGVNSTISIEGNNSAGIRLDGLLDGDLNVNGSVRVLGDNSVGISIGDAGAGGVTGDVHVDDVGVGGEGSIGVLVDAPITGALEFGGTITTTGYLNTTRPATDEAIADLDPDDLRQGGPAVQINSSVGDGILIRGVGVEDDLDDDGDGILDDDGDEDTEQDTNDDATSSITSYGSAPGVFISPNAAAPVSITIGAGESGFGFYNRGGITGAGVYDNVSGTGLRVLGQGGATVTIDGGILNDGTIGAESVEANAYAVRIGNSVSTPEFVNRRLVTTAVVSEHNDTAYGVLLQGTANVPTLTNTGTIRASLGGEVGTAIAIADRSNSLSEINNSGTILAQISATDSDSTDDEVPEVTGHAYAIDVGASTIGVTINQTPDVRFTDDDDVNNDRNTRPAVAIIGDVRLGSGADTINLGAGTVTGDITFGAGADVFNITNRAVYRGMLNDSDGNLALNITSGSALLEAGELELSSLTVGDRGRLGVVLSPEVGESTVITASGVVTFADGAQIRPTVPGGLPESGTQTFLTALGGLVGAENVTGSVLPGTAPFLYDVSIDVVDGDPNSLEADFEIKSTDELGLNTNQSIAFDPILDGLRQNDDAAAALSAITDQVNFIDAYDDLMPSYSSAAAEFAATAIQQQQGTASNRLSAYRRGQARDRSVWGQEIAYGLTRDPESVNAQEYRGYGFGFAAGIDNPTESGAILGGSIAFVASQVEEPNRPDGEISASFGQINGYYGSSLGALDLDIVAGLGAGKMSERRFIEIGDTFGASTEADWWAYEGHAAAHLSYPIHMGAFTVTPRTALTYVALQEQGYTEEGAGVGLDWEADSATSQRLWGDAVLEVGGRFGGRENDPRANVFSPRLMLGYRANLIDEGAERTFRLASGGDDFTLTDEGYGDGGVLGGFGFTAGNAYSSFSLAYEGEFGDELTRHSLNASVRINF
jgi:uncharacterized protein with beta-barrel porin domain